MKMIFKYLLNTSHRMLLLFLAGAVPAYTKPNGVCVAPAVKKIAMVLCLLLLSQSSFCQRNGYNLQPDSMLFFAMGISSTSINRQAFDQWTRANYNLVESRRVNTLVDFGIIGGPFDFGVNLNVGSAFSTSTFYIGGRLTSKSSPISSWLNLEFGEFLGVFTNIAPLNYVPTPDQVGQKLELHYRQGYIGLSSKNFLNFLHFNAKLGKGKIPFNTGFYLGAGFQPGSNDWKYGYYNTDTVFVGRKIHNIPKLGRVQVTGGVFVGF
jgi:hypothetical protein